MRKPSQTPSNKEIISPSNPAKPSDQPKPTEISQISQSSHVTKSSENHQNIMLFASKSTTLNTSALRSVLNKSDSKVEPKKSKKMEQKVTSFLTTIFQHLPEEDRRDQKPRGLKAQKSQARENHPKVVQKVS